MISHTVENYVKSIYLISNQSGTDLASTGQVAAALTVSPGTVTSMLKTLGESGLVTYIPYEGVRLTPSGTALALRIVRRHRVIELFLAKTLDLTWDEVHEEAENMEHAVSDRLIDRIDDFLGRPDVDPHGDPIPRADGSLETPSGHTLDATRPGERFRLIRVIDQSPEFLRYLTETGLSIGAEGRVVVNRPEAGIVTIEIGGRETTVGRDAAQRLQVSPL